MCSSDLPHLGFKGNMPDILSAIGLRQLPQQHRWQNNRREMTEFYQRELVRYNFKYQQVPEYMKSAYHLMSIILPSTVSRDRFIQNMKEKGIICSVHFKPPYELGAFSNKIGRPCTVANFMYRFLVSLPLYSDMTTHEGEQVVQAIKEILP